MAVLPGWPNRAAFEERIAPVTHTVDPALGNLAVVLVRGYQRFLSPHKGFVCAHRVRHGGPSCSEFAATVLAAEGLRAGLSRLRHRLNECRAAYRALQEARAPAMTRERDEFFDRPVDASAKATGSELHPALLCVGECLAQGAAEACCECAAGACANW